MKSDRGNVIHAVAYAAVHGWPVFPAPPGEKRSHKAAEFSNGRRWGASNDPAQVHADFTRWPDANIGIVTGPESGIFVLEADTLAGHGVDGIAALAQIEAERGQLPETRIAVSPSGSVHRYFRYPQRHIVPNSASQIAPGVDVRGYGGMVIAPPSVKPGIGVYRWLNALEIANAPAWLIELAAANKTARGVATPPAEWRELIRSGVDAGRRNSCITRFAGHLLRRRVDPLVALEILSAWNAARCRPPLDEAEVERIVDSVAGCELRRRGAQ